MRGRGEGGDAHELTESITQASQKISRRLALGRDGRGTTRNVFINDESLMTLTIFVTELGHLMTKLVASSWLTSDGALARRIMTKMETTSLIIETKSS